MAIHQEEKGRLGRVLGNVVGILFCVILIPIILINLVLISKTYTDGSHIPSIGGFSPVICLSGSMEDTFFTGDMILIRHTDHPAELGEGEVICYLTAEGVAVTHRIVQVTQVDGETRYVTQGDANNTPDQLAVSPDRIEGVYTGMRVPKLGSLAMFMQTTTGMLLFIVCPLLLLAVWYVLRRRIESKRERARTLELEARLAQLEQSEAGAAEEKDAVETRQE